jgi:hypothetical protein
LPSVLEVALRHHPAAVRDLLKQVDGGQALAGEHVPSGEL